MTLIEWLVMAWDVGIIAGISMTGSIQLGQESKCHHQFDEWTWIFGKKIKDWHSHVALVISTNSTKLMENEYFLGHKFQHSSCADCLACLCVLSRFSCVWLFVTPRL